MVVSVQVDDKKDSVSLNILDIYQYIRPIIQYDGTTIKIISFECGNCIEDLVQGGTTVFFDAGSNP